MRLVLGRASIHRRLQDYTERQRKRRNFRLVRRVLLHAAGSELVRAPGGARSTETVGVRDAETGNFEAGGTSGGEIGLVAANGIEPS
jgi:hypothetical protein